MKPTKPSREIPCLQILDGLYIFMPVSHTLPPLNRTNCLVISDSGKHKEVIIADPSPIDNHEYQKLVEILQRLKLTFTGILITHHHGDHHHQAPRLALEFSIPIIISRDSHRRIVEKRGESYFKGIPIQFAQEGDIIAHWNEKPVKVFEIPGHDEGQLGIGPESMEWFLAGDLIQSTGTVVIGTQEGDMKKYFRSLERMIQWNPRIFIPSHGPALTSPRQVIDTLEHRKEREKQVLHLWKEGKKPEEMVKVLYRGTNKRLWPLALENIKSHLIKLAKEN